jgi:hypothetical protein
MDWAPPDTCLLGHKLIPGVNVKVSWTPCDCPKATGRPKGHLYQACTEHWLEWRENNCDNLVDGKRIKGSEG